MATVSEAGAIAFKILSGVPLFLIVSAKQNPDHWIFPKGHVEIGEREDDAALRELQEEGGVKGEPLSRIGTVEFPSNGDRIQVGYYLIKYIDDLEASEEREIRWCQYEDALQLLSFDDAKNLLRTALPIVIKHLSAE